MGAYQEEELPDWAPFEIDRTPVHELEGFLFVAEPVQPASIREAVELGDNEIAIITKIKEEVPSYPFDQIPLIKPDMLVDFNENVPLDDISFNITYYTKASLEESLDFYRNALKNYDEYEETEIEVELGIIYQLSFTTKVNGGFNMRASVMVMEMPESTGYSCGISVRGAIIDAARKETESVGAREDGLPQNYPDKIVPAYKVSEIYMSEGDTNGCHIQFYSSADYDSAVEFYRKQLEKLTDFYEEIEPGEAWFSCQAPGWSITVRILEGDQAYIEINCAVE